MSKTIIKVENLGKKYKIGKKAHSFNFRQKLTNLFIRNSQNDFWALKNINFEVKEGEVLGIIGPNGAGKSTLLKILSRITSPTTGRIQINGRVSSLLEVGTGFHPELTGRENIYLNGAILGMKRQEIKRKFEEIVNFAEISKFLDTPVKHYSSGMYVRLAFAVAAHLEPEILVVDEVLSIGDFQFQKKSLGKMNDMSKKGRTVIFVSHNMSMIELLCDKTILLVYGVIRDMGPTPQIVQKYYGGKEALRKKVDYSKRKVGDDVAQLLSATVMNNKGKSTTFFEPKDEIIIEMKYQLKKDNAHVVPNFHVYSSEGICAFISSDVVIDPRAELKTKAGKYLGRCTIPAHLLNCENYFIGIALTTLNPIRVHFYEKDLFRISVSSTARKTIADGTFIGSVPGIIKPKLSWESKRLK